MGVEQADKRFEIPSTLSNPGKMFETPRNRPLLLHAHGKLPQNELTRYPALVYPFEELYTLNDEPYKKFIIATSLLEHVDPELGRFDDPQHTRARFLLDYFIPPNIDEFTPPQQQVFKDLHQQLRLTLLDQGALSPDSAEAQEAVQHIMASSETLQKIAEETNDPVLIGTIMAAMRAQHISDGEKLTTLRDSYVRSCIRPHLDVISIFKATRSTDLETDIRDSLNDIPRLVFAEGKNGREILWDVIKDYFSNKILHLFRDLNEEQAFSALDEIIGRQEDPNKQAFLQHLHDEFRQAQKIHVPQTFERSLPGWNGQESPFPLFRQKYLAWNFRQRRRLLLNGDTGATKTACSYLAMETVNGDQQPGAKRVLIFGPAMARDTWVKQAEKHFKHDGTEPKVFAVNERKDLYHPDFFKANYVFISSTLLGKIKDDESLLDMIVPTRANINEKHRMVDGIIIDEAHTFRNSLTDASAALQKVSARAQDIYQRGKASEGATEFQQMLPIAALTATPISNSLEDFNVPLGILYPRRFALPGSRDDKPNRDDSNSRNKNGPEIGVKYVFSDYAIRHPKFARAILFGERLMMQWSPKDLFGDKIPELEVKRDIQQLSPHERILYDFLVHQPFIALSKIDTLRDFLLNPELVKKQGIKFLRLPAEQTNRKNLLKVFGAYYERWIEWHAHAPQGLREPFSADWIAKFGQDFDEGISQQLGLSVSAENFLLGSFYNESLSEGITTLAKDFTAIHQEFETNWYHPEVPSTKYRTVIAMIEKRIAEARSKGKRPKIYIVSPFRAEAVTRDMFNEKIKNGDPNQNQQEQMDNTWSLLEYLKIHFDGQDLDIVKVDGSDDEVQRGKIGKTWREKGNRANVCVASMKAVNESGDLSITSNEEVDAIDVVFLSWPWSWKDIKQMAGRFLRPGIAVPVNVHVLETERTLEEGLRDLVKRKRLLTQLTLEGVELTEEERDFLRANDKENKERSNPTIFRMQEQSEEQRAPSFRAVAQFLSSYQGEGEHALEQSFNRRSDGSFLGDQFVEALYQGGLDEYKRLGQNARLVAAIANKEISTMQQRTGRMLSLGFGTGLFARMMRRSGSQNFIYGLDVNPAAVEFVSKRHPEIIQNGKGMLVAGKATHMHAYGIQQGKYDIVEASFMLDLTKRPSTDTKVPLPEQERVKVLTNIHNALSSEGRAILTLPKNALDIQTLGVFTQALEQHFGFEILPQTGEAFAIDGPVVSKTQYKNQLGWIITMRKKNGFNVDTLNPEHLTLLTDPITKVSTFNGARRSAPENRQEKPREDFPLVPSSHFLVRNPLLPHAEFVLANDILSTPSLRPQVNGYQQTATPGKGIDQGEISSTNGNGQVRRSQSPVESTLSTEAIYESMATLEKKSWQQKEIRAITEELEKKTELIRRIAHEYKIPPRELAERTIIYLIQERRVGLPSTWTNRHDIHGKLSAGVKRITNNEQDVRLLAQELTNINIH